MIGVEAEAEKAANAIREEANLVSNFMILG